MLRILSMYRTALFITFLVVSSPGWARGLKSAWFFAVISDPQMGMYASDRNFAQESANLKFAIANLNRLHPRFVVVCGDLVNRSADPAEIAEYKRILRKLDPSIPVYNVAGNHDAGNVPTAATLGAYRGSFGRVFYTFQAPGILGIVLDPNLIRSPADAPKAAQEQNAWLKEILASAKFEPTRQSIVFQHIPYFLHDPGEPENYFNIPMPARRTYLDLLENAGVRYVFSGHYHRNAGGTDGALTQIVSGAVGMPIGQSVSGFDIVTVDGTRLDSTWYCFGGIPNRIDVEDPSPPIVRSSEKSHRRSPLAVPQKAAERIPT